MFCPQCGIGQSEDLKFCKSCGANLYAVRQVFTSRDTGAKFDWSKTWLAQMLLSHDEHEERKREREGGIDPQVRRHNGCYYELCWRRGNDLSLFPYARRHFKRSNSPGEAAILGRVWIAGVIPFFVGVALLINGLFVSRRLLESTKRQIQTKETARELGSGVKDDVSGSSDNWPESASPQVSVTENTTRQLRDSGERQ